MSSSRTMQLANSPASFSAIWNWLNGININNCSSRVNKSCHLHFSALFQSRSDWRNCAMTLQTADYWQMAHLSLNRKKQQELENSLPHAALIKVSGEMEVGRWKNKNISNSPHWLQLNPNTPYSVGLLLPSLLLIQRSITSWVTGPTVKYTEILFKYLYLIQCITSNSS